MKCPNCNTELNESDKVCSNCGKSIMPIIDTPLVPHENKVIEPVKEEESDNTLPPIEGVVTPPKEVREEYFPPVNKIYDGPNLNRPRERTRQRSKKPYIFGGILLVVIAIVAVIIIPKNNEGLVDFKPDKGELFLIKENDKYGYINDEGNIAIKPMYEYATSFKDGYALASKASENKYYVINKDNEVIEFTTSYYRVEYDEENKVWLIDHRLYDSSLNLLIDKDSTINNYEDGYYVYFSKDGRIATVINNEGKKVYTKNLGENHDILMYKRGETASTFKDKYCAVSLDKSEYAIVNCDTGSIIMDYSGKKITSLGYNLFKIESPGHEFIKYIYIKDDEIIWTLEEDDHSFYYENLDSFFTITNSKNSKDIRYLDINTGTILDSKPESLTEFEKNTKYRIIEKNNKYGISKEGNSIVPIDYDKIIPLDTTLYDYLIELGRNLILLQKGDYTYLYDLTNKKIVNTYNSKEVYIKKHFLYYEDTTNNKTYVINLINKKTIEAEENSSVNVYDNYVTVSDKDNLIYYNSSLNKIYTGEVF